MGPCLLYLTGKYLEWFEMFCQLKKILHINTSFLSGKLWKIHYCHLVNSQTHHCPCNSFFPCNCLTPNLTTSTSLLICMTFLSFPVWLSFQVVISLALGFYLGHECLGTGLRSSRLFTSLTGSSEYSKLGWNPFESDREELIQPLVPSEGSLRSWANTRV